jgi:hypothetical protein
VTACEKCWADAYLESKIHGTTQVEEYERLVRSKSVCETEEEQ